MNNPSEKVTSNCNNMNNSDSAASVISKPSEKAMALNWPENIVADRHERSFKWVLHYLTDDQAAICANALQNAAAISEATAQRDKVIEECENAIKGAVSYVNAFANKRFSNNEEAAQKADAMVKCLASIEQLKA